MILGYISVPNKWSNHIIVWMDEYGPRSEQKSTFFLIFFPFINYSPLAVDMLPDMTTLIATYNNKPFFPKILQPLHLPHTTRNRTSRALSMSKDRNQNNPPSTQTMAAILIARRPWSRFEHTTKGVKPVYILTLTASVNASSRAYPVLLPAAAQGHRQYILSYLLQVTT